MILLASQSPRRAELLRQLQVSFEVIRVDVDESLQPDEVAPDFVTRLAIDKATAGWQASDHKYPVLGSDTIVVLEQDILGKPKSQADSHRMLSLLSGRTHQVMTAVAMVEGPRVESVLVTTEVEFKTLTEQEISWYWNTQEPQDKAGSYGIQGLAGQFVKQIKGSYSAVVGLPLFETSELLKQMGINLYER